MPVSHDIRVRNIFDRIAGRYDLLNRIISFRLDSLWRRKAIKALGIAGEPARVLDMGTGTGSLAVDACKVLAPGARVVGLDFSRAMLSHAKEQTAHAGHGSRAAYVLAHALAAPARNESFDAVMSAFVLRNVGDLELFFPRVLQGAEAGRPHGLPGHVFAAPRPFLGTLLDLLRKAHAPDRRHGER